MKTKEIVLRGCIFKVPYDKAPELERMEMEMIAEDLKQIKNRMPQNEHKKLHKS